MERPRKVVIRIHKIRNRGFVSFIGILISLVIVSILAYQMMKVYSKTPVQDKEVAGVVAAQGIDTSSYRSVIDSTKQTLNNVVKQQDDQWKRLERIK